MAIPLQTIGFTLMAPAPFVSLLRALLVLVDVPEPSYYWVFFAIGGSLSGIGIILVAIHAFGGPRFAWVVSGAAVAIIGHYVLPLTQAAIFGSSLVHIGTGIIVWRWHRLGVPAGIVAAIGAYLRYWEPILGNLLLLVGAAGLLAAILVAAMKKHHMRPST